LDGIRNDDGTLKSDIFNENYFINITKQYNLKTQKGSLKQWRKIFTINMMLNVSKGEIPPLVDISDEAHRHANYRRWYGGGLSGTPNNAVNA